MKANGIQDAALTVGAILGTLCLLAALASVLFGIKPLVFRSGSMEPTIPSGGLALSIPVDASDLRVGDIVSVENSTGVRVTHRVAAVEPATGYAALTLKGDANDVVDGQVYAVTEADRVFWAVPLVGYVVAWLNSPMAMFIGGLFTAYLLYVAFGRKRGDPDPNRSAGAGPAGIALAVILLLTGEGLHSAQPANAAFSSNASASSTFAAAKLSAPVSPMCELRGVPMLGRVIVLSWSHSGTVPALGYLVSVNGGPAEATSTSSVNLSTASATVRVRATHQAWISVPLDVVVTYQPGIAGVGASVTCTQA